MSKQQSKEQEKVRIPAYGAGGVDIKNLTQEEIEKLMACVLSGAYYAKGENGRIVFVPAYEKLPDPIADEEMLPFWRVYPKERGYQPQMFSEVIHSKGTVYSPSITIQSLCGYNYTPEYYKQMAERLKSYGFDVMRSQRGDDFKYWEHWFLPGLWSAKGDLEKAIKPHKGSDENQLKAAVEFLKNNASFGILDVSIQRLVARIPGDDDDY